MYSVDVGLFYFCVDEFVSLPVIEPACSGTAVRSEYAEN